MTFDFVQVAEEVGMAVQTLNHPVSLYWKVA